MLARSFPLLALAAALSLVAVAPPAAAWTVVCLGAGEPVCVAYDVIVEVRDGRVSVSVVDADDGAVVLALCVEPPYVWLGDCSTPPEAWQEGAAGLPLP